MISKTNLALSFNSTFLSRKALFEPYAKICTQIILNLAVKFLFFFHLYLDLKD